VALTSLPSCIICRCSHSLTKMMYQLPIDMMPMMISVASETGPPVLISATKP